MLISVDKDTNNPSISGKNSTINSADLPETTTFDAWKWGDTDVVAPRIRSSVSGSTPETGLSKVYQFLTVEGTYDSYYDNRLDLLEIAHCYGQVDWFLQILESIRWKNYTLAELVKVINFALGLGLTKRAKEMASQGEMIFGDQLELRKIKNILEPVKLIERQLPPDLNAKNDIQWLKRNSTGYKGKWVALLSGDLVQVADSYQELMDRLEKPVDPKVLITKVY